MADNDDNNEAAVAENDEDGWVLIDVGCLALLLTHQVQARHLKSHNVQRF